MTGDCLVIGVAVGRGPAVEPLDDSYVVAARVDRRQAERQESPPTLLEKSGHRSAIGPDDPKVDGDSTLLVLFRRRRLHERMIRCRAPRHGCLEYAPTRTVGLLLRRHNDGRGT